MDNNNVNNTNMNNEQPTMTQPNIMNNNDMPQGNVVSPEDIANTLNPPTAEKPVVEEQTIPVEAQNATPVEVSQVQNEVQPEAQVQPVADPQVVVDSTVQAPPQAVQQEEPKKVSLFQKLFGKKEKN